MGTEDLISVFGPSLSLLSCATICVQNFPKIHNSKPFSTFHVTILFNPNTCHGLKLYIVN